MQRLKLATSNLVCSLGFLRPIINYTKRKIGSDNGLGESPKILGFPFNIFATAEASDFKFGTQLGFANAHNKITRIRKDECGPGLVELPKI